jgi:hypothetical protein
MPVATSLAWDAGNGLTLLGPGAGKGAARLEDEGAGKLTVTGPVTVTKTVDEVQTPVSICCSTAL